MSQFQQESHQQESGICLDESLSSESLTDYKKNKSNRFFPTNAVDVLKRWFDVNQDYPYPDESTTSLLAREAKISSKQVRKWFANKRVRSNKCVKQANRGVSATKKSESNENSLEMDIDVNDALDSVPKAESTPINLASIVNLSYWQQQYNPIYLMYFNNQALQAASLQAQYQQQQQQQQLGEFEMTNSKVHNNLAKSSNIAIVVKSKSGEMANSLNDSFLSSSFGDSSMQYNFSSRRSSNASSNATDLSTLSSSLESFAAAKRRINFGDVSDLVN